MAELGLAGKAVVSGMKLNIEGVRPAVGRATEVQEVILRAVAKKITWWQAAEIIGISDRQMRRWRERCEQYGFDGLLDRRRCRPSEKRLGVIRPDERKAFVNTDRLPELSH